VLARFGPRNVNHYPTVFGVIGVVVGRDCTPRWYRVQLPIKPNGSIGYVRASALALEPVSTRILVDLSDRRLTLYESGKRTLTATVAVGSRTTPMGVKSPISPSGGSVKTADWPSRACWRRGCASRRRWPAATIRAIPVIRDGSKPT